MVEWGSNMYEYRCVILRVVDGDTADVDIDMGFGVWFRKQRIRFYGIDTPESRTRDLEEKKYGLMAKEIVKKWIPEGSVQTLITEKDDHIRNRELVNPDMSKLFNLH